MKLVRVLVLLSLLVLPWGGSALAQADTPAAPDAPVAAPADATGDAAAPDDQPAAGGGDADTSADHGKDGAEAGHGDDHGGHAKHSPHPLWMLPFVVVLGCIALGPLFFLHWWEHRYPYVAAVLFLVGLFYYLVIRHDLHPWFHEMREYTSFIALLFALFVVSGGIVINVSRKATPTANVLLLLTGAIIANIFGTTGAAMLLIRPYIRINRQHIKPYHIVFFIFIVANVGGCLTPIGDPPLFLGYLKGVPFWWVLEHCWQPWLLATVILLGIFFVIDMRDHAKEERHDWGAHDKGPAVRINGLPNFLLILVIIFAVFRPSIFASVDSMVETGLSGTHLLGLVISREVIMVAAGLVSFFTTKKGIHETNAFTFAPIREVAILFLAIFSTMVPALEYLDANAEKMPLETPGHYYYATGTLSSMLDNAPTYLTFLQARLGKIPPDQFEEAKQTLQVMYDGYEKDPSRPMISYLPQGTDPQVAYAIEETIKYHADHIKQGKGHVDDAELKLGFLTGVKELNHFLVAISSGAVFFGAMTYIGNAPNFMVKSIAESSGIQMPSFLGYVFRFGIPFLLPVLIIVWAVFLL